MVLTAVVFYKPSCYFSKRALRLLSERGYILTAIDVSDETPETFTSFINETTNQKLHNATVPQILIDQQYIGGCTDLETFLEK